MRSRLELLNCSFEWCRGQLKPTSAAIQSMKFIYVNVPLVGTVNRLFLLARYFQPHHTLIRYTTHLASTEIWQIQSKWQPLVLIQGSAFSLLNSLIVGEGRWGGTGGEGYTVVVYQNIYWYHFSDPSIRESTFINKIAYMVDILSSPIRP